MPHRRGFTLVELLVALTLFLVVSAAIYRLLTASQRLAVAQVERAGLQADVRAGWLVVANELRELNTRAGGGGAQNDILSMAPSDLTYRATRGLGFVCQPPSPAEVRIARDTYSGFREIEAFRDSAYVFLEGDPSSAADDGWLPLGISAVTGAGTCGGAAAITLRLSPANSAVSAIPAGTPVRIYEIMELRLYRSGGRSWLGARSVSAGESIQPVVGPLADDSGFALTYLDLVGAPTADRTRVASIGVTLRGVSDRVVHAGWSTGRLRRAVERLDARVALRNAGRP